MKKLIKEKVKQAIPFAFKISGNLICTRENTSIRAVAKILAEKKIGAIIIKKKDRLCGIISERDIVWRVVAKGKSPDKLKAKDIMTSNVVSVDLNEGMGKIHQTMSTMPFRHLPVRKGNNIIGMVSNRDLVYLRKLKYAK
jgi:signal-transduction protein with cAMP-binding, CBS, and nucleotidyltransferase domain